MRRKGETLIEIEAPTAEEAVARAIKLLGITERERQRRLVAQRVGS